MNSPAWEFLNHAAGAQITRTLLDCDAGCMRFALTKDGMTEWIALKLDEIIVGEAAMPSAPTCDDGGVILHDTTAQGPKEPTERRPILRDPDAIAAARAERRDRLKRSDLRTVDALEARSLDDRLADAERDTTAR